MISREQFIADWPTAVYCSQEIPEYRGNPLIEALPPILDDDGVIEAMQNLIRATLAERALPSVMRMHLLERISQELMQPLEYHIGLFHRVSILLRRGYVDRNPSSAKFVRDLMDAAAELKRLVTERPRPRRGRVKAGTRLRTGPGSSLTLIGASGVGKTTAVEAILRCYDQVIHHNNLQGPLSAVYQLVWLKLSVPRDGSIRSLCIDFLEAIDELLGTRYGSQHARQTVDNLIIVMGRIAFLHGLGLLVIDELQNLNVAKSGGAERMMNTFKQIRDVMKVPVMCIGTLEAIGILTGDLQLARRASGLEEMKRMSNDRWFRTFCESLFDACYLREPMVLTDLVIGQLYWFSQGITDIVVKLFVGAQSMALSRGLETLPPGAFEEVYNRELTLLHPFLYDIRNGSEVDGPSFDQALGQTSGKGPVSARMAYLGRPIRGGPRRKPDVAEAPPAPDSSPVSGVKARRRRRTKGEPSECLLVRVVEEAAVTQIGPHEALRKAGFIRHLGAEVLAQ
jgi:hypothetical protein